MDNSRARMSFLPAIWQAGRAGWLVFLFFLSLYLLTARGRLTVIDGVTRYQVTAAIAQRGSVSLPEDLHLGMPGKRPGSFYSYYALGQSLAGLPLYWAGGAVARLLPKGNEAAITQFAYSLINAFMAAGLCAVFFVFCLQLGYARRTALWLALGLGLGTILWQQSKDSFEHPQEAFFGLAGVLLTYRGVKENRRALLWVGGVLFGAGILTRGSAAFFFLPALGYLLTKGFQERRSRGGAFSTAMGSALADFGISVAGALPFLLAAGWYNALRWGSPFAAAQASAQPLAQPDASFLRGLAGLLISPGRGLLEYNPMLLLLLIFPASLSLFWRRQRGIAALFLAVGLIYLIYYSNSPFWDGGLCWGPRYLLPIIPLALFPLGELIETPPLLRSRKGRSRATTMMRKSVVYLLAGVSLLIQLSSVLVDHQIWFHEVAVRNQRGANIHINLSPRYSPLVRQWQILGKVLSGSVTQTTREFNTGIDFWWVCWPGAEAGRFRLGGAIALAALAMLFAWRMALWREARLRRGSRDAKRQA